LLEVIWKNPKEGAGREGQISYRPRNCSAKEVIKPLDVKPHLGDNFVTAEDSGKRKLIANIGRGTIRRDARMNIGNHRR